MSSRTPTLSELVPGYPQEYPQTLAALLDANPQEIEGDLAWGLRKHALAVTSTWEQHHINSPWDVLELIVSGYIIHPWEGAWRTYALSGDRQPVMTPSKEGRMRYLSHGTRLLPKPDDLGPLPTTGNQGKPAWLVVYGGTPDVLSKAGVAQGLTRLIRTKPIADIVFYSAVEGQNPTLWSIKAGTGVSGTSKAGCKETAFADPDIALTIREALAPRK